MFLNFKFVKILINLLIMLIVSIVALLFCEITIRNTSIFEKYGWQTPLSLDERIKKYKSLELFNNENIIKIGDSNVEYMRE